MSFFYGCKYYNDKVYLYLVEHNGKGGKQEHYMGPVPKNDPRIVLLEKKREVHAKLKRMAQKDAEALEIVTKQ